MFSGYLALTRSFDRAFYYRVLWFSFPLGRACVQQLVQRAVADSEEEKERARESKRERKRERVCGGWSGERKQRHCARVMKSSRRPCLAKVHYHQPHTLWWAPGFLLPGAYRVHEILHYVSPKVAVTLHRSRHGDFSSWRWKMKNTMK